VLVVTRAVWDDMVSDCVRGAPLEACGLLVGPADEDGTGRAMVCVPAENADASARVYTIRPLDLLRADRRAEEAGAELLGVYHSHTHTEAYPSPTDVDAAPDPGWHYVIVSLRDTEPTVRSYRIAGGRVEEEPVVLE
jgi:[CysO sulfur-carrier protein]-S-L-cysteine hydrolase